MASSSKKSKTDLYSSSSNSFSSSSSKDQRRRQIKHDKVNVHQPSSSKKPIFSQKPLKTAATANLQNSLKTAATENIKKPPTFKLATPPPSLSEEEEIDKLAADVVESLKNEAFASVYGKVKEYVEKNIDAIQNEIANKANLEAINEKIQNFKTEINEMINEMKEQHTQAINELKEEFEKMKGEFEKMKEFVNFFEKTDDDEMENNENNSNEYENDDEENDGYV